MTFRITKEGEETIEVEADDLDEAYAEALDALGWDVEEVEETDEDEEEEEENEEK